MPWQAHRLSTTRPHVNRLVWQSGRVQVGNRQAAFCKPAVRPILGRQAFLARSSMTYNTAGRDCPGCGEWHPTMRNGSGLRPLEFGCVLDTQPSDSRTPAYISTSPSVSNTCSHIRSHICLRSHIRQTPILPKACSRIRSIPATVFFRCVAKENQSCSNCWT